VVIPLNGPTLPVGAGNAGRFGTNGADGIPLTRESNPPEEAQGIREKMPVAPPASLAGTALPSLVDLRSEMPPVGFQGLSFPGQQACGSWAGCYQLTQSVKHFLHPEWDMTKPEHQFSPAFLYVEGGATLPQAIYVALRTEGCTDMAEMPYDEKWDKPTPAQLEAAKPYRIRHYAAIWDHYMNVPPYVPTNDLEEAKAWLADGYSLMSAIPAGPPGWPDDGHGNPPALYYDPPITNQTAGHFVTICGYDDNINPSGADADHRGGFLMINSMGPDWNGEMHGYLWISYAWVKSCVESAYIVFVGTDTPSITGCSPQSGYAGDVVTITGNNFGTNRRASGVSFNGVRATTVSMTNEFVTALVPPGATSGPLIVNNWEGTPSNQVDFQVRNVRPPRRRVERP
jgi:hypothetical protein